MDVAESPVVYGRGNLRVCRRGHKKSILLVALFRPAVKNAFNDDLYEDLIQVLRESSEDDSIAALVLTGEGDYFSSGADLRGGSFVPEVSGRHTLHKPAGRFMMAMISYPKILGAAVQGPAVGIGFTLLMHCDLVWCSELANFWAPFTRLALVPEFCSSETFLNSMGMSKANELLLLGKSIDADTALKWNICSKVVSSSRLSKDPFAPTSLAGSLCSDIDKSLLSLPNGDKTARYFVSLIRGKRRKRMEEICRDELVQLDERFDNGQVLEAAKKLKIGSQSKL